MADVERPMEKFRIIRDDGLVECPAVSFVSTNLRARRVPWFFMPFSVGDAENFDHHNLANVYEIRDTWFYVHNLLDGGTGAGSGDRRNMNRQILDAIRSLGVVPEFETHRLIRAQVNCVHKTERMQITPPHRDFDKPGCVYVYYVNDSDGDTILFDDNGDVEAKVTPSAGHLLRMDSRQWHCQTTPVRTDRRMVINFNFEEPG